MQTNTSKSFDKDAPRAVVVYCPKLENGKKLLPSPSPQLGPGQAWASLTVAGTYRCTKCGQIHGGAKRVKVATK
jgi:hypothetical protein